MSARGRGGDRGRGRTRGGQQFWDAAPLQQQSGTPTGQNGQVVQDVHNGQQTGFQQGIVGVPQASSTGAARIWSPPAVVLHPDWPPMPQGYAAQREWWKTIQTLARNPIFPATYYNLAVAYFGVWQAYVDEWHAATTLPATITPVVPPPATVTPVVPPPATITPVVPATVTPSAGQQPSTAQVGGAGLQESGNPVGSQSSALEKMLAVRDRRLAVPRTRADSN